MSLRHTIFMSHAHDDNAVCQQYAAALRDRYGFDVWIDIADGQTAGSLPGGITTQLVQRSAFVLMLTRTSNVSQWVGHELDNFIAYAYTYDTHTIDGVERVVLPIFLEASLPPILDGRATNSAKVQGKFWVNAADMSFDQAVAAIAHALDPEITAHVLPCKNPSSWLQRFWWLILSVISLVVVVIIAIHFYITRPGTVKWSYAVGDAVNSSPDVVNGKVYVGANTDIIYALDAGSGALQWSYRTGNQVSSSPDVVNGVLYVGSDDGKIYALNANTGALKWSYKTAGFVASSPMVVNGVLYVGSDNGQISALNV